MAGLTRRITPGQTVPPGVNRLNNQQIDNRLNEIKGLFTAIPEGQRNNGGKLKYPLVNQEQYKGKITFQPYEVIPPTADERFNIKDTIDRVKRIPESIANVYSLQRSTGIDETQYNEYEFAGGNVGSDPVYKAVQSYNETKINDTKNKGFTGLKVKPILNDRCDLYLPLSYVVNDNISYNTPDLGLLGGAIAGSISSGSTVASSINAGLQQAGRSVMDFFNAGGVGSDVARLAAVRALSALKLSDTVKNAISLAGQVTVNPNTRALFDKVALREFTFQFKFIPKSREESAQVRQIIQFFRKHAYPETISPAQLPIGYKFPNMFKIGLTYDGQVVGTKIKLCYLRNIQTNYNPTQASFHNGGDGTGYAAPTEIDLSISFIEHKTLSRQDILENGRSTDNSAINAEGGRQIDGGGGY